MKKYFFISLVALIPSYTFMAQKSWGYYNSGGITGPYYSVLKECQDTIIEDQVWTELKEAILPIHSHRVREVWHRKYYRIEDNVYYWLYSEGRSTILYDFNVIEGDSITRNFMRWSHKYYVTQTDSVLFSGILRKRVNVIREDGRFPDVWVEGIGSIVTSFLGPVSFSHHSNLCFYETPNSELWIHPDNDRPCFLYDNPFHCDYVVTSKEILDADKIEVSPNPFDPVYQEFTIKGIDESTIIHIVNSNGQSIFCGQYSTLEQMNMSPGIYYMKVHYGVKTITKKLIAL